MELWVGPKSVPPWPDILGEEMRVDSSSTQVESEADRGTGVSVPEPQRGVSASKRSRDEKQWFVVEENVFQDHDVSNLVFANVEGPGAPFQ